MGHVVFIQPDGAKRQVEAVQGQSLMQVATAGLVPGIVGECGGQLSCATCHVYVDEYWTQMLPARSEIEEEMLEVTSEEPTSCSRLSCQVEFDSTLDGIVVAVPKTQQ